MADAAGARAALLERQGPPGSDTPRGQPWSPPPKRGSCPTIPVARWRGSPRPAVEIPLQAAVEIPLQAVAGDEILPDMEKVQAAFI